MFKVEYTNGITEKVEANECKISDGAVLFYNTRIESTGYRIPKTIETLVVGFSLANIRKFEPVE
jgi:hypothetical protein